MSRTQLKQWAKDKLGERLRAARKHVDEWLRERWWSVERHFPGAAQNKTTFDDLIRQGVEYHNEIHTTHPPGFREEIKRDVIPFYLLGPQAHEDFIDLRGLMWRDHVETYSKIKKRDGLAKAGSSEIDYVAGHLDIIDRKFSVLLSIQGLMGVVISVTVGAFKEELLSLHAVRTDYLSYTLIVLFIAFLISAWTALALIRIWLVVTIGCVLAVGLYLIRDHIPDYWAAALIIFVTSLWITTTLVCLRGTGRARWGGMKKVPDTANHDLTPGPLKDEHDYQLLTLIRAVVGRTAMYRAGVLLVFTTLYCLIAGWYITALVLVNRGVNHPKAEQPVTAVRHIYKDLNDKVTFLPGDKCETSPTAMSQIARIAQEVEDHDPAGLLIVGSADGVPLSPNLARTLGDNSVLAQARGYCVADGITKILRLKGRIIPIEVLTRGHSLQLRANEDDRVADVTLIQPSK